MFVNAFDSLTSWCNMFIMYILLYMYMYIMCYNYVCIYIGIVAAEAKSG